MRRHPNGPNLITYSTVSLPNTGFGSIGINLNVTAHQTNSVQIISTAAISADVGINAITNNSPNAALILGDSTANQLVVAARPAGAIHNFVNNSTNAAVINASARWVAGGGNAFTMGFGGPGNWMVNNYLRSDSTTSILKDGSGTMTWTAAGFLLSGPIGPVNIDGGTVILKSPGLLPTYATGVPPGNNTITNNGTLIYDAAAQSDVQSRIISGTGLLKVSNGTLTLSGANTYAGNTILSGGTLQVGAGGTSGSTGTGNITDNSVLVFNRSDNVTFTKVISGGGSVVQLGSGTLTLFTNSYSGTTTVSNGTLVINGDNFAASTYVAAGTLGGTGTFYGPVMLDPGTTLAPGAFVGTLTINSDLSIGGNLAIEVNKSLSPPNDLVVVSGVLTNTGTGTLTVANLGPALAVGDKCFYDAFGASMVQHECFSELRHRIPAIQIGCFVLSASEP